MHKCERWHIIHFDNSALCYTCKKANKRKYAISDDDDKSPENDEVVIIEDRVSTPPAQNYDGNDLDFLFYKDKIFYVFQRHRA